MIWPMSGDEEIASVAPQLKPWQILVTFISIAIIIVVGIYKESLASSVLAPALSGGSALLIVFLTVNLAKRAREQAKSAAGLLEVERKSLEESTRQGEVSRAQARDAFVATLKAQADERTSSIMVRKIEARIDSYRPHRSNEFLAAFDDYDGDSNVDVEELDGRSQIKIAVYFRIVSFGKIPTRLDVTIPGHSSSKFGNFEWLENKHLGKISGYPLIPEKEIFIKWVTLMSVHEIHEELDYVGRPDGTPAQVRFRSVSLDGSVVEEVTIPFRFKPYLDADLKKVTGVGLKADQNALIERLYPKIPD